MLEIDGDDVIIGKQVFNVYNRIYNKNPDIWFMYSNYLAVNGSSDVDGLKIEEDMGKVTVGVSLALPWFIYASNNYRTNTNYWVTRQLRSYLRDLYVKIPL